MYRSVQKDNNFQKIFKKIIPLIEFWLAFEDFESEQCNGFCDGMLLSHS